MKWKILKSALFSMTLTLSLSNSPSSLAQDAVVDETTIKYPAAYFEEFSPLSAKDMMDRIPGLSSGGGGGFRGGGRGPGGGRGGRGLGSGSGGNQVLINGKRMAGKNNQTSAQLDRITADQVEYIEIIRGTSGELDVRGSGQVVNVVLFEELSSASISYEVNMDHYVDGKNQPGGSVSYSNQIGELGLVLSAAAEPRHENRVSKENSVLGDFSPNDRVREERTRDQTSYDYTANFNYEINSKSSARFNVLYSENDNPTDVLRQTTDLTVNPNILETEREDNAGERSNWEIGGDYEYLFESGNRFKVLFISNEDTRSSIRERYEVAGDGSEVKDLFLNSGSVTKERIIRGSYTMDVFDNQNIEFGAERAQTILESTLALGLIDDDGIPSAAFGGLVPVDVDNANSTVEEIRYEPFLIHNWIINPRMSLESTLLYETSEIKQSGDVSNKRDFDFVKPKLDFRFDLTPTLQLRASVEKVVEQLNFNDFVAATDDRDNDSDTQAGNSNLKQEWYWKYDLNLEYRLPNDVGVVSGNLFYHDFTDKIDRIDVSTSDDDLDSANGNIGDGERYGLNLRASIRMRMIDMPNLLVTSRFNVQESKIEDPFLGIDRRFAFDNRGQVSLGFRHDLPQWNVNYGANWNNRFDGGQKRYDIDDITVFNGDPFLSVFAELIAFNGITFRFDVRNASSGLNCNERLRYVGRISDNDLEEIESRCSTSGRVVSLKINGTF